MTNQVSNMMQETPVVPLVQAEDPATAVEISRALAKGGLKVAEVLFRTDAALECLRAVDAEVPEMLAGAGTVLNAEQAEMAIEAGAKFIVAPGLDVETVKLCLAREIPVYPGVMTPSEAMVAYNMGLRDLKLFPASVAGGVPMIKAICAVLRDVRFMPTGGVTIDNLHEFLAVPQVLACGGSWLTPKAEIEAGNFDAITTLAAEAVAAAKKIRG